MAQKDTNIKAVGSSIPIDPREWGLVSCEPLLPRPRSWFFKSTITVGLGIQLKAFNLHDEINIAARIIMTCIFQSQAKLIQSLKHLLDALRRLAVSARGIFSTEMRVWGKPGGGGKNEYGLRMLTCLKQIKIIMRSSLPFLSEMEAIMGTSHLPKKHRCKDGCLLLMRDGLLPQKIDGLCDVFSRAAARDLGGFWRM